MAEVELSNAFAPENAIEDSEDLVHHALYKIIIIGDSGVGKTGTALISVRYFAGLLARWIEDKFTTTSATINVEFATRCFRVDGKIVKGFIFECL